MKRKVLALSFMVWMAATNATADVLEVDTYDPATNRLTIRAVQIGDAVYTDVVVTFAGSVVSVGGALHAVAASADAFCVYFPDNGQYYIESAFDDPTGLVSSATITGSGASTPVSYAYNMYPDAHPGEWWTNPNIYLSTGTQPAFPLNYSISILFRDGTTQVVNLEVGNCEVAQ